jgi:integrase
VEAFETGQLGALRLRSADVALTRSISAALRWKEPDVAPTTLQRYETALSHFQSFCGPNATVRLSLTTENVQAFKKHRLDGGAKRETVNNDLGGVSVLSTYCLDQGLVDSRPKVKRFKSVVRIRYLEPDQINLYMAAVRRPFRTLFGLLIGSAARLGEAEALRICDLRLSEHGACALVEDAKTPEGVRPVFLPLWVAESLRAHIEEHRLSGTDPLFSIPRRTVQKEHSRACRIAGIHAYTIHDHRHTAAVSLARASMPLHLLQQQLGHTRIEMTMRYARFHPEYGDVALYFERVGESLGFGRTGNRSGNTTQQPEARINRCVP